jgi:2-dehydropantoate 2-reductase
VIVMRILVLGAGAIGGYFGGRLAAAGRDVSFLVRPRRAAELAADGLVIESAAGNVAVPSPRSVLAADLAAPYDLILLTCKAYSLDEAVAAIAPAVGPASAILPLLNGMRHLDILDRQFGRARVLGGQCAIAATLDARRRVVHLSRNHDLSFGERDGGVSQRVEAIAAEMRGAAFDARASADIVQEMWEKWVFLAALAAGTCLLRATIGDIVAAPGGVATMLGLFDECRAIAAAEGFPPREEFAARSRAVLTAPGSDFAASMLRDIENRNPVEADHIIGDLLDRGERAGVLPEKGSLLRLARTHLAAYEARLARLPA